MPISKLTAIDTVSAGDQLGIGSATYGNDRKAALSVLAEYLQDALAFEDEGAFQDYLTQYATPSATSFSVQITDADDNIHLILAPAATYAAGTIVFPTLSNLVDKQEIIVNSTKAVTALTINGNGATVVGAPYGLDINSYFRFRYDAAGTTWYLIGSSEKVLTQGTPAAKTTSTTLTAAEIALKIITVNQGAGAPSALQLPLASAMDSQFSSLITDQAIEFSLINISTNAAETASITTNTGWSLVGNMLLAANTAVTDNSQGTFRARKTGTAAWSLYRIA